MHTMHYTRFALVLFVIALSVIALSRGVAAQGLFPNSKAKFVGSASCAASACHSAPRAGESDLAIRGNEYTIWHQRDPHARAQFSLTSPKGKQMLSALGIKSGSDGYENCLRCHNLQPKPKLRLSSWQPRENVSCESCHGPTEKWIKLHATDVWPNTLDDTKRDWLLEAGFVPPKDMARKCVECHVGAFDREVNHELLAAGHPELEFEFSKRMNSFPKKHWRTRSQTQTEQLQSGQQANALRSSTWSNRD
jgi:hypothetical protein